MNRPNVHRKDKMPVTPLTDAHGAGLAAFLHAFDVAGEAAIPGYFAPRAWPVERVADTLAAWSRGEQLAAGWVPCTTHFATEAGELVGVVNFRHVLTPALERYGGHVGYAVRPDRRGRGHATALLRHAMGLARARGLEALLLTCAPDNAASARVIAKCGGALTDRYFHEGERREVLRWRLAL